MQRMGTLYIHSDTYFHKLDGSVKLLFFMSWTIITFLFLDLRVFVAMLLLGILCLIIAKIPFRTIKLLVWLMLSFNLLNAIFLLLITPTYGTELTGTRTDVLHIGYSTISLETIFYVITLSFKYANLLPITLILVFTTHPSSFAASLNKLGIPYKIAYAINIAFRYIPDIQAEIQNILHSQQARGIGFKKGEGPVLQRAKHAVAIAVPLVISSLQRIEVVSNAMDLRGFGKHKHRTWYISTRLQAVDLATAIACMVCVGLAIYLKFMVLETFWYPF